MIKDSEELLFKIIHNWEKKRGITISIILFIGIYYTFLKPIILEGYNQIDFKLLNLGIPLIFIASLTVIWLVSSKRIPLLKAKGDLTVGLFIFIDDEDNELKIKKIVKQTKNEIENEFKNLKIRVYPFNFLTSKLELRNYLSKNSHSLDSAIFCKIKSGNKKDIDGNVDSVLEFEQITHSGKFDVYEKFKLFRTNISLINELNIRNINKNWSYVESNSIIDKTKIKANIKDITLFYSGIYLIYLQKTDAAINILKSLQNSDDSSATIDIKRRKIIAKSEKFLSSARLNEILHNLYMVSAITLYENKNTLKAYSDLKECETIFGRHNNSFDLYISLARFSYELNKFSEAIEYTKKAKEIKPDSASIYLNQGFFAILENDENELIENYKQLSKVYKHSSSVYYTEVIAWLNEEKKKHSDKLELFEFAIGALNLFYSDENLGKRGLIKLYKNDNFKNNFPNLHNLIKDFLEKGSIKSVYYKKRNIPNKKKKRKPRIKKKKKK